MVLYRGHIAYDERLFGRNGNFRTGHKKIQKKKAKANIKKTASRAACFTRCSILTTISANILLTSSLVSNLRVERGCIPYRHTKTSLVYFVENSKVKGIWQLVPIRIVHEHVLWKHWQLAAIHLPTYLSIYLFTYQLIPMYYLGGLKIQPILINRLINKYLESSKHCSVSLYGKHFE